MRGFYTGNLKSPPKIKIGGKKQMKKKFFVATMMVAVTLMVSGCGNQLTKGGKTTSTEAVDTVVSTEVYEDEAELKAQCLARAQHGDILSSLSWGDEPLAPEIIIQDYLSGEHEYLGRYYTIDDDNECISAYVYLGDMHIIRRYFFPGATLDGSLTMENLVADYLGVRRMPWVTRYSNNAFLFSENYRHCLEITTENWLEIDEIRVYPVGILLASVEPADIVYAYQHGQWDGSVPAFSYDCGTSVKIDKVYGNLFYQYESTRYTDDFDPKHYAYKGYNEPLEFLTEEVGEVDGFVVKPINSYEFDFENGFAGSYYSATVEAYVDLPNGSPNDFEGLLALQYINPEKGIYVIMSDKIERYCRGELMGTWEGEIDATMLENGTWKQYLEP